MRIDRAVSRGIAFYLSTVSKKAYTVAQFSPYDQAIEDAAEEAKEGTIHEVFDLFRSLAKHGK
jgi:hypothetical protein